MKYFILSLTALFIASQVYAFDWKANAYTVAGTETAEGKTTIELKDAAGRLFSVSYYEELPDRHAARILQIREKFYGWKNVQIARINFFVSYDLVEASVIPSKFEYKKVNVMTNLPAGMLFTFGDDLFKYNFRITKNNLFVRIKGDYTAEDALCEQIIAAIKNPLLYLKKRDTEYLLNTLTKLEDNYETLRDEHRRLKDEHEKLLYFVMTVQNTNFFGFGKYPIDKKVIEKVISMKKANPKITKDEISKSLEKDQIKASGKEIDLIIGIYFNEFK